MGPRVAALIPRAAADIAPLIARAAENGAGLVALALPEAGGAGLNHGMKGLRQALDVLSPLAARHALTVAAGPVLDADEHGLPCPCAILVAPDGTLLGRQLQTHRAPWQAAAAWGRGGELPVWEIAGIRLGLVAGEDANYPEVSRILCLQGARLLVHFGGQRAPCEAARLAGLWREVQANQSFGIECLAGDDSGRAGSGAILAPVEMTEGFTGELARAEGTEGGGDAVATLDAGALDRVLAAYNIRRQANPELYRTQLLPAYGIAGPDGGKPAPLPGEPSDGTRPGGLVGGAALAALLWWRSRPGPILAALGGARGDTIRVDAGDTVRIGLAQTRLRLAGSGADYARHMGDLTARAVAGGARLVIFPEYITLPLLGLIPRVARLAASGATARQGGRSLDGAAAPSPAGVLTALGPAARRVYLATFSALAARHAVHILAGSAILTDESGRLRNTAYLFGPDGRVIGRQDKTHLVAEETAMGMARGVEVRTFDTPLRCLAAPVCMDHTYWETARIATQAGARILVDPSFESDPAGYSVFKQLRGVWGRVQESPAFGAHCFLVGDLLDYRGRGRSMVCAPLELTATGDGILAQARTVDEEEIVLADLDVRALGDYREARPRDFNPELYARYLPRLYQQDPVPPVPAKSGAA